MASATSDRKRRLRDLLNGDPGTPAARNRQLAEADELSASIRDAERVEVSRNMDARRRDQMTDWAMTPGVGGNRRSNLPAEVEALRKVAHLHRSGLPQPLKLEDLAHGRLSRKEALELLDLTQRALRGKGEFTAADIPRRDALLEKACGAAPAAISRWDETMVNYDGRWVRKADIEAYNEALAEFKAAEARLVHARRSLPPAIWEHRI